MRIYVALGITLIWAVSYIGSVITANFTGFEVSTPVMLTAAAYLFSAELRNGHGKRPGGGQKP